MSGYSPRGYGTVKPLHTITQNSSDIYCMPANSAHSQPQPRYVVGIDLGTTNSALAYVDTEADRWAVRDFPVPQLTAAYEVEARPVLPSFHYEPAKGEFPPAALKLPWQPDG